MTIKDRPVCGGTHYGSSECPQLRPSIHASPQDDDLPILQQREVHKHTIINDSLDERSLEEMAKSIQRHLDEHPRVPFSIKPTTATCKLDFTKARDRQLMIETIACALIDAMVNSKRVNTTLALTRMLDGYRDAEKQLEDDNGRK